MMKILKDLTPLNRVFCSKDYDKSIEYLLNILPFNILTFTSEDEVNGWVIPPKWDVKEAKILKEDKVIYNGLSHPLAVISQSKPCRGSLNLEELKQHLFYATNNDDAIPFHFRQQYKSWERDWGFCVTKKFFDSLEPGMYEVIIETEESEGVLKVLDYTHKGKYNETFAFVAHLDHPGMANDNLAGCAVGIELFKQLKKRETKFNYKLLLVQEIIGSELYLANTNIDNKENIFESLFLEMLGSETQLALQKSLNGNSNIEYALIEAMDNMDISYRTGHYRSIVGNDECIWESYEIPMASFSRYPYPEYHTDKDDISIISEESLNNSVDILIKTIDYLESTTMISKKFRGNLCLSNPKYDLYIDPGQAALGGIASKETRKLRLIMDLITTLHKPTTLQVISKLVELPEEIVFDYLKKWEEKGLLALK